VQSSKYLVKFFVHGCQERSLYTLTNKPAAFEAT
jgi:hypothetical protein